MFLFLPQFWATSKGGMVLSQGWLLKLITCWTQISKQVKRFLNHSSLSSMHTKRVLFEGDHFFMPLRKLLSLESICTLYPKSFSLAIMEVTTPVAQLLFSLLGRLKLEHIAYPIYGLMQGMQCECVRKNKTSLIYSN